MSRTVLVLSTFFREQWWTCGSRNLEQLLFGAKVRLQMDYPHIA